VLRRVPITRAILVRRGPTLSTSGPSGEARVSP
jgi:hypothetical protein